MKLHGLYFLLLAGLFMAACGNEATENAQEEAPQTDMHVSDNSGALAPQGATTAQSVEPAAPAGPTTKITFKYLEYDFGKVEEGKIVKHEYEFTNTGSEPLIISDAKASCGCTVPVWPKEPIAPGEKGKIQVEFDSKNKPGPANKTVSIFSNTEPNQINLTIKGQVEPRKG